MRTISSKTTTTRLEGGVANLGTDAVTIEVCEGAAWITQGTDDIFAYPGQMVILEETAHPILVSPLKKNQAVVFKTTHHHSEERERTSEIGNLQPAV